jgi:hypothetical protein
MRIIRVKLTTIAQRRFTITKWRTGAIALGTAKVGTMEDLIADLNEVEDEDIME